MVKQEGSTVEVKLCGSDTNPFLALAAIFHSICAEPSNTHKIPLNLDQAIESFKTSKLVKEALGEEIQEHFSIFFENELSVSI